MHWIIFIFLIYHNAAFGFWNDNHIKKAWNQHRGEIEAVTSSYPSAQKGYKMAYWAANEAYKRAKTDHSPEELASIRSYLQLSSNIFGSGAGFGGIKSKPINPETRDLAKKTLTILGLMIKGDPFFSFEKKSTLLVQTQKYRAKEFVEKVQKIKIRNNSVDKNFQKEIETFLDDKGENIFSKLLEYEPISLFPATLKEENLVTDVHLRICPECKEMQTTASEMEDWWKARIKEDSSGRGINFTTAFGGSFESHRTIPSGTSSDSLQYLKNGQKESFRLPSGVDFSVYIPKYVKPGTPVVFKIYDGIKQDYNLYHSGFIEETVLAHAGCIVVWVQGMHTLHITDDHEPADINQLRYNYTNFPDQIFEDIEDIYTALRDQTFLKKDGSEYPKLIVPGMTKVFLTGSSFGGYMTMMAATSDYEMKKAIPRKPFRELFDGYIPSSGFYDWAQDQTSLENSKSNIDRGRSARNRDYKTRTLYGNSFKIRQHSLYLAGDPLTDSSINNKMSPIYHLGRLSRPVLLMHGLKDPNVGVDAALNLLHAVEKAKKQYLVDSVVLPEQQHDLDGNGGNKHSVNKFRTVELIKDYFDPILYFIRQIQNDERPDLEHSKLKTFKEKAQNIKLESAENKLLNQQEKGRHEEDNPLAKLIKELKQKLKNNDATLIDLLKNPTEERIIDFAKDIPIYKNKNFIEFSRSAKQDLPAVVNNEEAKKRLMMLFLDALLIAMEPLTEKSLLKSILHETDLRLSSKTKPDSPFLWLEAQVLEDLKEKPRGWGNWLSERATALGKLKDNLSDENIIEYLKKLPSFFGIAGPYEMTPFFYQLKRKEIRQAIRYVLFPNEWLFDKLKVVLEEERGKEEEEKRQNRWHTPYIYLESFPYNCEKFGKPGSSLPSEQEAVSIHNSLIPYLHEKLPNEPVKQRFSDFSPYTMDPSEFIKKVQGYCSRISEQVTVHREFIERLKKQS